MVKRGRTSLHDQLIASANACKALSLFSPKPLTDDARAMTVAPEEKVKRVYTKRAMPGESESDAQSDVVDWLLKHPRVHGLKRINSGSMSENYVRFNTVYGKHLGHRMNALDLEFWITDPLIPVEIEMKKPAWKKPDMNDKSERGQFYRIEYVRAHGGIAGFCRSVKEVEWLIGGHEDFDVETWKANTL